MSENGDLAWWQRAVVYQVYPKSFQDSDGDGIGDLKGIRGRLDYLAWLGVDALWLSPVFVSPMADNGYDIADYCAVDPVFGTVDDFDGLLADLHARGMKLILDFVPNHTSDRHPWFENSRLSRDASQRDWYVWRDPGPDGGPPSNWRSTFGGSAWTFDAASGQYYLHQYLPAQPDLNWRNPAVREAMHEVLRFWLRRGVDGFRVDAVTHLIEDELLRSDPDAAAFPGGLPEADGLRQVFTADRPETHDLVCGMRAVLDEFPDRVLIGETHLPVARLMAYYGGRRPGFHLPFNFMLMEAQWTARSVEASIDQYVTLLPGADWRNWVLGNHDESRVATRIGPAQARVAATLALTLHGTPFIYEGEELGLEDVENRGRETADHPEQRRAHEQSRDAQRTPMPWDGSANAGFTTGRPWLPVGEANAARHGEAQRTDPASMLSFYRALLALRRKEPALVAGDYVPLAERGDLLSYERRLDASRLRVTLNFGDQEQRSILEGVGTVLLSTDPGRTLETIRGELRLRPHEGLIVRLEDDRRK